MWTVDHFVHVVLANSIPQGDKRFFPVNNTPGKTNSVTDSLPICLVYKMCRKLRVFLTDVILDFIAKVADNENKFFDTGFAKLIRYNTQNRFASKRNQSLGLRI